MHALVIRLIELAAIAVGVTVIGAANAAAATVAIERGNAGDLAIERVRFAAGPGEVNALTVARTATDAFAFTDDAAVLAPGPGCTGGGAPGVTVTCTTSGLADDFRDLGGVGIELGDGDDSLDATGLPVSGTEPQDELVLETRIDAGAGNDSVAAGSSYDRIDPGPGDDAVDAGPGDDSMLTAPVDGDDLLEGGSGINFDGRGSVDEISYRTRTRSVTITVDELANDGERGEHDRLTGFELLASGGGDDELTGGVGTDAFDGLAGDDRLSGRAGNDSLDGGPGADQIFGQAGADGITGGSGADLLFGGVDSDFIYGYGGADRIDLGGGRDFGSGDTGDDSLSGDFGNDHLIGGAGNDRLRGGRDDDRVIGMRGADRLGGGAGADLLDGLHGVEAEVGLVGRDGFVDRLACGRGRDAALVERDDRRDGCERVRRP